MAATWLINLLLNANRAMKITLVRPSRVWSPRLKLISYFVLMYGIAAYFSLVFWSLKWAEHHVGLSKSEWDKPPIQDKPGMCINWIDYSTISRGSMPSIVLSDSSIVSREFSANFLLVGSKVRYIRKSCWTIEYFIENIEGLGPMSSGRTVNSDGNSGHQSLLRMTRFTIIIHHPHE